MKKRPSASGRVRMPLPSTTISDPDWRSTMLASSTRSSPSRFEYDEQAELETTMRLHRQYQVVKLMNMADDSDDEDKNEEGDSSEDEEEKSSPVSTESESEDDLVLKHRSRSDAAAQQQSKSLAMNGRRSDPAGMRAQAMEDLKARLYLVERQLEEKRNIKQYEVDEMISHGVAKRIQQKEQEWLDRERELQRKISQLEGNIEAEVRKRLGEELQRRSIEVDRLSRDSRQQTVHTSQLKQKMDRFRISFRKLRSPRDGPGRDSESTAATVDSDPDNSMIGLHAVRAEGSMYNGHANFKDMKDYIARLEASVEDSNQQFAVAKKLLVRAMEYQAAMDNYVYENERRVRELEFDKNMVLVRLSTVVGENEKLRAVLESLRPASMGPKEVSAPTLSRDQNFISVQKSEDRFLKVEPDEPPAFRSRTPPRSLSFDSRGAMPVIPLVVIEEQPLMSPRSPADPQRRRERRSVDASRSNSNSPVGIQLQPQRSAEPVGLSRREAGLPGSRRQSGISIHRLFRNDRPTAINTRNITSGPSSNSTPSSSSSSSSSSRNYIRRNR